MSSFNPKSALFSFKGNDMEMQEGVTKNNGNTAEPVAAEKASSVAEAEDRAKAGAEENARLETESESE